MKPRRARFRVESLEQRDNPSVSFHFDYSLDTGGFFNDPAKRAALEQAGFAITSQLNDSLSAITPSGSNSWNVTVVNPLTGLPRTFSQLSVNADEIVVYAVGGSLAAGQLGYTAPTSYTANGTSEWLRSIQNRGEALGEFAPWGGMVEFNSLVNWNLSSASPTSTQFDFQSAAQHELMHILGFGAGNPVFEQFVSNGLYVGPNVTAIAGGPIAVVGDASHGNHPDHWVPGTTIYGEKPVMLPQLLAGEKRLMTAIDLAALADMGWTVDLIPTHTMPPSSTSPTYGNPIGYTATGEPIYSTSQNPSPMVPVTTPPGPFVVAVGASEGSAPTVTGYDKSGRVVFVKTVFENSMTGGVRVAVADFNGDGTLDLAVGTGIGFATRVRVIDGVTSNELFTIRPFETSFTGGVFLAAGDITGDGKADLAIAAGTGGGPRVRVFGGATMAPLADFFAIEDAQFRGGTRTALADFTGDGKADLVVAAGIGGGPRVAVYEGTSFQTGIAPKKYVNDFFTGTPALSDGAFLATGDTNGDGIPELVTSAGPTVTVYDGKELGRNKRTVINATFAPPTADSRSGARIVVADISGDSKGDIITFASLKSSLRQVAAYSPLTMQLLGYDI